MALEDPNVVDLVTRPGAEQIRLVIVDAGVTTDPDERYGAFLAKLRSYVKYVLSEDFSSAYPDVQTHGVTISVMCKAPPTDQMAAVEQVTPRGDPAKAIKVEFEMFS
ncbi:MAG TPA: DUF6572 domain-containing protein [Tepidisphaeraceae bacterium]|nr:DUF6572 domain-containing protein [Tepidisphaeraceae bacterium]